MYVPLLMVKSILKAGIVKAKGVKLADLEKIVNAAIASGASVHITVKDDRHGGASYERSCARKVKYGRQATALRACADMATKNVSGLEAYECKFCKKWHIGHGSEIAKFLTAIQR